MELLEFKNKILNLLNVNETKDVSKKLLSTVIGNKADIFDKYIDITDNTKDWLQALWQYYEADRVEKKQDYTPKSLCKLVTALSGDCTTVYDCCGGSGALTIEMIKNHKVDNIYVEELDENVIPFLLFNLCLHNTSGFVVNGDVLSEKHYKIYKLEKGEKYSRCTQIYEYPKITAEVSISNPPYNIKWCAPTPLDMDSRFPIIPPASNANWAFALNCLSRDRKSVV